MASQVDDARVVRVFVSSTFRDMQQERDILVRQVFPALRARFRARGVELQEVDLRWGITHDQVEHGHTLEICLSEIDRCKPYFIALIGHRYGWVPPAAQAEEVARAFPSIAGAEGRSMTELEVLHALSRPEHELHDSVMFFVRSPTWLATLDPETRAEMETADPEARRKLVAFKQRIADSGTPVMLYESPDAIGRLVETSLGSLVDRRYPESAALDATARVERLHAAYARERRGFHVGAEIPLATLNRWAEEPSAGPLLVTGPSGGGKSTLLANWTVHLAPTRPDDLVIEHYLAASPDSASPARLLRRLWSRLDQGLGAVGAPPPPGIELRDLAAAFAERLAEASSQAADSGRTVWLLLDGLDQLGRDADLRWWPRVVGPGVRLLAASLPGEALEAWRARGWSSTELAPFDPEQAETYVRTLLASWGRQLANSRVGRIVAHPLSGNPRFLKGVLEELRYSAIHERLDARLDDYLQATTLPDFFARRLVRIEGDLGEAALAALLRPLLASRAGLEEADLLAL
ncbi:MAG: DUF4062 domain-containing protein, partial [Myxococcota bacterium]